MQAIPRKKQWDSESNKHLFTCVNNVMSALINHLMMIIWFKDKIAKSKSPLTDFYLMLSLIELLL